MWQTRVLDPAFVHEDETGLYIEVEEVRSVPTQQRFGRGGLRARRLAVPPHHADAMREAQALGRRVRITYSRTYGSGEVDLVEIV